MGGVMVVLATVGASSAAEAPLAVDWVGAATAGVAMDLAYMEGTEAMVVGLVAAAAVVVEAMGIERRRYRHPMRRFLFGNNPPHTREGPSALRSCSFVGTDVAPPPQFGR